MFWLNTALKFSSGLASPTPADSAALPLIYRSGRQCVILPVVRHFLLALLLLIALLLSASQTARGDGQQHAKAVLASAANERLESEDCSGTAGQEKLLSSYKQAWQLVKDNTMFPERLNAWSQWEHHFDGHLKTDQDLENAIKKLLAVLHDKYTYLRSNSDTISCKAHDEDHYVVSAAHLPHNLAYIKIRSFSSLNTASELESTLKHFQNPDAYILDLRNNRGGYVEQALQCFELMADEGKFVTMDGREDGKPYHESILLQRGILKRSVNGHTSMENRKTNLCANKPIVVLVTDDTRSAAEMLAGALRDSRKAKLAGSRTYGKGIVQNSWNLESGCSIKVAMARYFLPRGEDINSTGIIPDIKLEFQHARGTDRLKENGLAANDLSRLENLLPGIMPDSL